MHRLLLFTAVNVAMCLFTGCNAGDSVQSVQQDPLYDLSTWDFGDKEQIQGNASTAAMTVNRDQDVYAIAVATFTGPMHESSAKKVLANLQMQYPNLASQLQLKERSRGSVLAFGSYKGFDDPRAKSDIQTLRKIADTQG